MKKNLRYLSVHLPFLALIHKWKEKYKLKIYINKSDLIHSLDRFNFRNNNNNYKVTVIVEMINTQKENLANQSKLLKKNIHIKYLIKQI